MSTPQPSAERRLLEEVLGDPEKNSLYLRDPEYHALVDMSCRLLAFLSTPENDNAQVFALFVMCALRDRLRVPEARAAMSRMRQRAEEYEQLSGTRPFPRRVSDRPQA